MARITNGGGGGRYEADPSQMMSSKYSFSNSITCVIKDWLLVQLRYHEANLNRIMSHIQSDKRRRFEPGEVIISEVTKKDLLSVVSASAQGHLDDITGYHWSSIGFQAEGYYSSFGNAWFDKVRLWTLHYS